MYVNGKCDLLKIFQERVRRVTENDKRDELKYDIFDIL
jgi:hypothetical protein